MLLRWGVIAKKHVGVTSRTDRMLRPNSWRCSYCFDASFPVLSLCLTQCRLIMRPRIWRKGKWVCIASLAPKCTGGHLRQIYPIGEEDPMENQKKVVDKLIDELEWPLKMLANKFIFLLYLSFTLALIPEKALCVPGSKPMAVRVRRRHIAFPKVPMAKMSYDLMLPPKRELRTTRNMVSDCKLRTLIWQISTIFMQYLTWIQR